MDSMMDVQSSRRGWLLLMVMIRHGLGGGDVIDVMVAVDLAAVRWKKGQGSRGGEGGVMRRPWAVSQLSAIKECEDSGGSFRADLTFYRMPRATGRMALPE